MAPDPTPAGHCAEPDLHEQHYHGEPVVWCDGSERRVSRRLLYVRHTAAPAPDACRWCGVPQREHANCWTRGHGWHTWEPPTPAQRRARMWARRARVKVATDA